MRRRASQKTLTLHVVGSIASSGEELDAPAIHRTSIPRASAIAVVVRSIAGTLHA